MGAQLQSIDSGEGDGAPAANSEINVTPFVDVMLVLLIIFMVAAPLATVDIPVDLPKSNAPPVERPTEPIYVSVKPGNELFVGEEPVDLNGLGQSLLQRLDPEDDSARVFVRADSAIVYGDLIGVMNTIRDAGYEKVGLTTEEIQ